MKGSGRKRGKQQGTAGSSLPWVAVPDEHVAHRPHGACGCGADLAEATEVGIERSHQTHDLPEIRITVRQHDLYRVRCGCGREHVAALPEGVSSAPCSYGVNLRSLVVYLLVYQHVPVGRCVELIGDLTGSTGPSSGFVHSMLARCAAAVRDTVTLIKTLIISADVVGFDETTLRWSRRDQALRPVGLHRATTPPCTWVGGTWPHSESSGSCPPSPESPCMTRYQNYYRRGSSWRPD